MRLQRIDDPLHHRDDALLEGHRLHQPVDGVGVLQRERQHVGVAPLAYHLG